MNEKLKQRLILAFGFLLIGCAIYAGYTFVRYLANLLLSIDKQLATAIIAASGTFLAAVLVALYSQRRTKDREIAEAHRPQKIEVYKSFMETIAGLLKRTKDESTDNSQEAFNKEFLEFFVAFTRDLIVWGSPGMIKAYYKFRTNTTSDATVLLLMDDILREIRKDLGNSNWSLKRGELIRLFLSDPEELERTIRGKLRSGR